MYGKYHDEYQEFISNKTINIPPAKQAVFSIIRDITSRKGIGYSFEEIDDDIQEEIIKDWIDEITYAYNQK